MIYVVILSLHSLSIINGEIIYHSTDHEYDLCYNAIIIIVNIIIRAVIVIIAIIIDITMIIIITCIINIEII